MLRVVLLEAETANLNLSRVGGVVDFVGFPGTLSLSVQRFFQPLPMKVTTMKHLLAVLFLVCFAVDARADEASETKLTAASARLKAASNWSSQIEVFKTLARSRKESAYAVPLIESYISENKNAKCGTRLALRMAEMTLYAVKDGDEGLNRFLVASQESPGSARARELAKELLDEKDFVPLFDGNSLKGWEGKKGVFRVEKSAIVAGNLKQRIPNNEFLCTEKTYSNFELRLQALLKGEGKNAGIQFRSKRIPNHHEVIGYQADIGVSGKDHSIWGALYDESRRRKFLAEGDQEKLRKAVKSHRWVDFVIRCEGPHIRIWVNGLKTVDYKEEDKDIAASGIIGLQIHSGPPAEAWYRNIRIRSIK